MSNQMHALYVPDGVTPSVHVPVRQADGTYSVPVACDGTGKLGVTGIAGGGGGSGDASAAKQDTQIARETEIRDRLPTTLVAGALPVVARGGLTALGFEQITALSSSAALTVPSGATIAVVQAEGMDVRWRPDGATTAPTASVGMLLPAGAERVFDGGLSAVRFIQTASGAVVNVSYYQ